jgi:hypothetical protein
VAHCNKKGRTWIGPLVLDKDVNFGLEVNGFDEWGNSGRSYNEGNHSRNDHAVAHFLYSHVVLFEQEDRLSSPLQLLSVSVFDLAQDGVIRITHPAWDLPQSAYKASIIWVASRTHISRGVAFAKADWHLTSAFHKVWHSGTLHVVLSSSTDNAKMKVEPCVEVAPLHVKLVSSC